jgi:hypothetical protein
MLLTIIVQIFDEELTRLRAVRAILAPLQQTVSPLIATISEVEQLPASVPTITRLPAREAPMRRVRKSRNEVLPSATNEIEWASRASVCIEDACSSMANTLARADPALEPSSSARGAAGKRYAQRVACVQGEVQRSAALQRKKDRHVIPGGLPAGYMTVYVRIRN